MDNENIVSNNIDQDMQLKKIKEEVLKKLSEYRTTIAYMASDAPLSVLCLPKTIENALLAHGYLRIYDLFNCDFTEIKGLGVTRIRDLTTRLDQFVSMF